MSAYRRNHVKIDRATERFAIRSAFDDEDPGQEHLAWTVVGGARAGTSRAKTVDVDGWDDLYVPEEPSE